MQAEFTMQVRCLCRLGLGALLAGNALPIVQAADSGEVRSDPGSEALETVVISGVRASLASAQSLKRERLEIVDAVAAEDIIKLPDFSVIDALQRITGVQIARDRGEGTAVAVRGLTQMETMLNGREVFTAGTGRSLEFADIPAEMLSTVAVYKTSAANHIEGGVGGMVDLQTYRPFDFAGSKLAGSVRVIHGDLIDRSRAQLSGLLSRRWVSDDMGEFGVLLNASYQERGWREDQKGTSAPLARNDIIAGQTVIAANGTSETTSAGQRKRTAGAVVLQWRPTPSVDLYAEANYAEFRTLQDSYQINVSATSSFVADSLRLFPGTNDLQSITWINAPISVLSFARDTVDRNKQAALGGSWRNGAFLLKADVSYAQSFNHLFFSGPILAATAANFSQDLSGSVPDTRIDGTNLLEPATFNYTGIAYRSRPFDGALTAAQLDGSYTVSGRFIDVLSIGLRYAKRTAGNAPGLIVADAPVSGISAADKPGFVVPNPYGDFFSDAGAASIGHYLVGSLDGARDAVALRSAFGIVTPIPDIASPLSLWSIREQTQAAYVMAKFKTFAAMLDGNLGLRMVRTQESVTGAESVPTDATLVPIKIESSAVDYLPSMNLRYRFNDRLTLRVAASKTLTRPNFDQLSPSLTLIRNSIDPSLNQGSAGNPELKPVRAKNLDAAVEVYFGEAASVYLTGFLKEVDGFVTTVSNPEIHDGAIYQVSRPQSNTAAHIKGVEIGYQQFFDALPGWMRALGVQINYTYVDSDTLNRNLGAKLPLQNLSQHSYNLVGLYEKNKLSARLAYNWRSKFLSGVSNIVNVGALPIYTKAYGWLDASLNYRFNNALSIAIEGQNLLGTVRSSYYSVETRPQSSFVNDMQLSVTATVRF